MQRHQNQAATGATRIANSIKLTDYRTLKPPSQQQNVPNRSAIQVTETVEPIEFYALPISTYAAKVRIVLDLKGIPYQEKTPPNGYGSEQYRAIVPAGSIPAIVIEGKSLHDSTAIGEFLDTLAYSPTLLPQDPWSAAQIRALLGFHDTRVEPSVRGLFPLCKRAEAADPAALKSAVQAMRVALEKLSTLAKPAPYALGNKLTLADCAYPATLQMMQLVAAALGEKLTLPAPVDQWMLTLSQEPAVRRSLKLSAAGMAEWLATFRCST